MDDTVYITNGGDTIAVDQTTGVRRWTFTPADFSPLTQTPAIANGVVYVTGGRSVFALDQATGQKIWRHNLEQQTKLSAPSVANGVVYVGGLAVYALSATDGHLVWRNRHAGVNVSTLPLLRVESSLMPKTPSSGCGPSMRSRADFSGDVKGRVNPKRQLPSPTASSTISPIMAS